MSKEKTIFEMAIKARLSLHTFKESECMFHKGFKFEMNKNNEYNVYDTRNYSYRKLNHIELDMIIEYGIYVMSDLFSFRFYNKIIDSNLDVISNKNFKYKTIDKANKNISEYKEKIDNILIMNKKNVHLFVY